MAKYSRDKGARGELLFRDLCREHGYDGVIRTAQHSGKGGTADVTGLPGIHEGQGMTWWEEEAE